MLCSLLKNGSFAELEPKKVCENILLTTFAKSLLILLDKIPSTNRKKVFKEAQLIRSGK